MKRATLWSWAAAVVWLGGGVGVGWAQDAPHSKPAPLMSPVPSAASPPPLAADPHAQAANPAPYLQAILSQLVVMNHQLSQSASAHAGVENECMYEDRSYTEGAVLRVGAVALVCVPASAFAADARASAVDGEQISDQQQRYTWAPLNSPRIAAYRKSVGLPPALK